MIGLPEALVRFVDDVYRETGAYPEEIVLPIEAWSQLCRWAEKICRIEEATEKRGAAILLAQGTKIRLGPTPPSASGSPQSRPR